MKQTIVKRVLSLLLVCIMLVTMLPMTALADEVTGDEIYDNTDGEIDGDNGDNGDGEMEEDEEINLNTATPVVSAQELEAALLAQTRAIRIAGDFELDRTFYITADTIIFSLEAYTLTRAATFGGDVFVVGENADGTACEEAVSLTVGHPESEERDLLIIDGNKDNMTVDVTGTVFFVLRNCTVDLYHNLTVTNAKKVGNEKTLTGNYTVSYAIRVGGPVAILTGGSEMTIFGGTYTNNSVNDIVDSSTDEGQVSTHGGAFYNYGTMRIYGGNFTDNYAARGGALYNYRTMRIYAANISRNTASSIGGAIYMPNSTAAFLYLGGQNATVDSGVTFSGNTAVSYGGAIYARNVLTVENTVFSNNAVTDGHGGAISAGNMTMSVDTSSFDNNTASGHGGAIYYSGENDKTDVPELAVSNTQFSDNSAASDGGAVYVSDGALARFASCGFEANTSNDGAAFYSTNGKSDFDSVDFVDNVAAATGGAVAIYTGSTSVMNAITAAGNRSNLGGFLYNKNSKLTMYDSLIQQNASGSNGGGLALYDNAVSSIYNSTFDGNTSGTKGSGNGGAMFVYTGGTNTVVHTCTFKNNYGAYGGAVYASNKSLMDMYNNKATANSAKKGGFLYETTTGTTINLVGITLSGNTATEGGPIIWGNSAGAVLNIDKSQYFDRDYTGDWDDAYWAAAIYNSLKVKEIVGEIPTYIGYDGTEVEPDIPVTPVDVTTAGQLERALEVGSTLIRINADFALDRTFYITRNTMIYSVAAHTLTRAADFGGDLFVVGETSDGEACENEVVLTLGDPESSEANMLTIDGNRDNMTVDVTGSVLFVTGGCTADLYGDIVIKNAKKVGNEKTLTGAYGVSYAGRVGGAVAILAAKSTMNIYGGTYTNNSTNDITDADTEEGQVSSYGGAFYNFGLLNVYGGTFSYNHAGRGGAFYAYRTINIYHADIRNNTASTMGGAIYMPNSTAAFVYIGTPNDLVESTVTFADNSAASYGGAIYARNVLTIENTTFSGNSVTASSGYGGAIAGGTMTMSVTNSTFTGNASSKHGGAIYFSGANNEENAYDLTVKNTLFEKNSAKTNGGAMYVSGGARVMSLYSLYDENGAAIGGAFYMTGSYLNINGGSFTSNTATGNAGAIMLYSSSTAVINNITADGNESGSSGGFLYSTASELKFYNSRVQNNTAAVNGGGLALYDNAVSSIYNSTFDGNTSGTKSSGNGGAVFAYTGGTNTVVHTCTFKNNYGVYGGAVYASNKSLMDMYNNKATANSAKKGGFLYETTTGTTINLVGITLSGNTATEGGPIIWGNSTGAKLYIDKAQVTDLDHSGTLDATYWAAAIVNKLKVYDFTGEIPKWLDYGEESYDHMADAVDVRSAAELEKAILDGARHIHVIADFAIDRTFYITGHTTIFSTLPHTLTRAANFAGDIFVVGEDAAGTSANLLGSGAMLTLGNPMSVQENLLTIDGNKDNMTVDVTGTVLFISNSGMVDLHPNVSIINAKKVDNDRTYLEKYILSRPNRIGGAMSIIALGTLNIYGGNYRGCEINEEDTSTEETRNCTIGGLIYNNSNLFIYGGTFADNRGARGAIVYNYRMVKMYGGSFIDNHATVIGGVLYSPNAAQCQVYIGTNISGTSSVLFENNTAVSYAGALYSSPLSSLVIYGSTSFVGNVSGNNGGAICAYGQLTVRDTVFEGNQAKNHGGAVYAANSSDTYVTRYTHFENCTFNNNQARYGGALSFYASDDEFANGAIGTIINCDFTGNVAQPSGSNTAVSYGGAIYVERRSSLSIDDSNFTQNVSKTEGGAIYAAGESDVDVANSTFTENATMESVGTNGGAIAIHSVYLDMANVDFVKNTAVNGAALYVSYTSARDVNSQVTMTDCAFTDNASRGYGGAIYATRHDVTTEKRVLTVKNTEFTRNTAQGGGAVNLTAAVQAYFKDVVFTENVSLDGYGGAIYLPNGNLEIDKAVFTGNTSSSSGGAIYMTGGSVAKLNDVTAVDNEAAASGGFLYSTNARLDLYNSTVQNNTAGVNGGGVALYQDAASNIYATVFDGNVSEANGGGLFLYTDGAESLLHTCTFTGNTGVFGGAIYASNASIAEMYNITATGNASDKGGFLYETTTGTTVTMSGVTVSGNTASVGGPIIWGNSVGAVLNINTTTFTDLDESGELDGDYWAQAIVNKLTVSESTVKVPTYKDYVGEKQTTSGTTQKTPVSVNDVFSLGLSSSDEDINSTYNKFPRLDNSSNFMSKNVTSFDNVNGGTVTVDTFVYPISGKADNCNVGQGLLIYQAMLYKQAHPEEEVYIDISSYRFSVQAAVNINRNSRYFGYMRQLSGNENYDKYGFVRIAYLLITAAKMGIHVTAIGHIDAYPVSSNTLQLVDYFESQLNDPCDPDYVADGVIGDYLNFKKVHWSLDQKGGTDMMHTKLCAVSHYLDMNGVEHRDAVWTSSTNLDGITAKGYNANYKVQTATIVSDHADLYRTSVNYLRLLANYCGQEQIYEFQDLVRTMNTEQAELISTGREDEIAQDKQIIYLGSETDDVFELYFTPYGGSTLAWDELTNPHCKYLRKLYDSEDYITFTWNAAEYNGNFPFGRQIEEMIIAAFHKNRNPRNAIYANMESFDASSFDDLEIGVDIGFKSFNQLDFGAVHNKDLQFSYVEDGERYYVSLLNSMNFHSGSMYYQSNFALVIKERTCSTDSVFSTLAQYTTKGDIVQHAYDNEEHTYLPDDVTQDGYVYVECVDCGHRKEVGTAHRSSDWITDVEPTETATGIQHTECSVCDKVLATREITHEEENQIDWRNVNGKTFTAFPSSLIPLTVDSAPHTIEATIHVPKSRVSRVGVIVGNYSSKDAGDSLNLEVYTYGRLRLYYVVDGQVEDCIFNTDIRSDTATHVAVSIDGTQAALYVNGALAETAELSVALGDVAGDYTIGGDKRVGNACYFSERIYSVSLFGDVRTAQEIKKDSLMITDDADALLYTGVFSDEETTSLTTVTPIGKSFSDKEAVFIEKLSAPLHTVEAVVKVPTDIDGYVGVLIGNLDGGDSDQMNLEIVENGALRLVFATGAQTMSHTFGYDVRSDRLTHIAVTVEAQSATLYVDGVAVETATLSASFPQITDAIVLGADNTAEEATHFRGEVYAVHLFDDVRTAQEIAADTIWVNSGTAGWLYSHYFVTQEGAGTSVQETAAGMKFSEENVCAVGETLASAPRTIEATVQLPKTVNDRAGVIVGNYNNGSDDQMNLEVYTGGRIRLFYIQNKQRVDCVFSEDIRSDTPKHIAVTVDGLTATLYIDGELSEQKQLDIAYAQAVNDFKIGGDNRRGNAWYFRGLIYSVYLFSDVRTAQEIRDDKVQVSADAESLLYAKRFTTLDDSFITSVNELEGKRFDASTAHDVETLTNAPRTIEATILVDKTMEDRAGVIVGNYDGSLNDQINLEVYTGGRIRLFYVKDGLKTNCLFSTDIRSDVPRHVAVTVGEASAALYVDGVLTETVSLTNAYPYAVDGFRIGGDNRYVNAAYFKGTIYTVSMFSDVRTAEEIRGDMLFVPSDADALLLSECFAVINEQKFSDEDGKTFSAAELMSIDKPLAGIPYTMEATVKVPTSMDSRVGVVLGNYRNGASDGFTLEIFTFGRVRLFYVKDGQKYDYVFSTDIRSDSPTAIAVTIDGTLATLYVNGAAKETKQLATDFVVGSEDVCIGGDNRSGNAQYFKGKIYSVYLFDVVRTVKEIRQDAIAVSEDTGSLLYSVCFEAKECESNVGDGKHVESDWITDYAATETHKGIKHKECIFCGCVFVVSEIRRDITQRVVDYTNADGLTFNASEEPHDISDTLSSAPKTFEVTMQLPTSYYARAGVLVGNNDGVGSDLLNLEIYTNGCPRLWYKVSGGSYACQFTTDVRSDDMQHLAITIDGLTVSLYVNGVFAESVMLQKAIPSVTDNYCIGGDHRANNPQYFKGTIYAVHLFDDVRTAEEIARDAIMVTSDAEGLLYSQYFAD